MRRPQHQDHLNAKESGETQRNKRKTKRVRKGTANKLIKSKYY